MRLRVVSFALIDLDVANPDYPNFRKDVERTFSKSKLEFLITSNPTTIQ